jgi:two-component system, NarL family, nitrate/nitrite response regulator NarL
VSGNAAERVQVVFAEDHELFRAGMARAIAAHPELELVAEASNGVDALDAIERLNPHVALIDVRMPGMDGLELCRSVADHDPPLRTRVVLVTAFPDEVSYAEAAQAGAVRLLGKQGSRAQMCAELLASAQNARLRLASQQSETSHDQVSSADKGAFD